MADPPSAAPAVKPGEPTAADALKVSQNALGSTSSVPAADAAFTAVTGISANVSTYRVQAPQSVRDIDPPLLLLESKEERHLARITGKEGRATLTVVQNAVLDKEGVDLKTGQAKNQTKAGLVVKYKTADFFVTSIQSGNAEAVGIDLNDIGFTFHAMNSNPETLSVQGTLLNGADYTQRFAAPGMIIDTDWFGKFLYDYESQLKASKSLRNGDRIFFSCRGTTYEVYIVGLTTMEGSETPDGVPFAMQMVVKRKILAPKSVAAIKQIEDKQKDFFITGDKDGKKFTKIKLPATYKIRDGKIFIPAGRGENLLGSIISGIVKKP